MYRTQGIYLSTGIAALILWAILSCSPAKADAHHILPSDLGYAKPPARYNHEPKEHYGVFIVSHERTQEICGYREHTIALGCAVRGLRLIYINASATPAVRRLVLEHEKAHLNGWKH